MKPILYAVWIQLSQQPHGFQTAARYVTPVRSALKCQDLAFQYSFSWLLAYKTCIYGYCIHVEPSIALVLARCVRPAAPGHRLKPHQGRCRSQVYHLWPLLASVQNDSQRRQWPLAFKHPKDWSLSHQLTFPYLLHEEDMLENHYKFEWIWREYVWMKLNEQIQFHRRHKTWSSTQDLAYDSLILHWRHAAGTSAAKCHNQIFRVMSKSSFYFITNTTAVEPKEQNLWPFSPLQSKSSSAQGAVDHTAAWTEKPHRSKGHSQLIRMQLHAQLGAPLAPQMGRLSQSAILDAKPNFQQ